MGCHDYEYTADFAIKQFDKYLAVYGGPMWLTEFALCQSPQNPDEFRKLTEAALGRFERIACYTNEQDGSLSNIPWPVDLCTDGILTPIGEEYAEL